MKQSFLLNSKIVRLAVDFYLLSLKFNLFKDV